MPSALIALHVDTFHENKKAHLEIDKTNTMAISFIIIIPIYAYLLSDPYIKIFFNKTKLGYIILLILR